MTDIEIRELLRNGSLTRSERQELMRKLQLLMTARG